MNLSKINTTYQQLADYIFSFFSSCTAPGQGLFLFRTLDATARESGYTQARINLCYIIIFNLLENGYLEAANEPSPFVRLTEKGFDYLQGDDLIKNQINLKEYIDLSKEDSNLTFNGLWTIIGIKEVAPFYVDGPTFFNTINPFVNVATNYSAYIQMLSDQKKSTSRHTWFKTLFLRLKKSDIPSFLDDLSLSIYKYYDEKDTTNQTNSYDIGAIVNPIVDENRTIVAKKVFITYCWENDEHNAWVHNLANDLDKAGFDIFIDIKQPLGIELNRFMEQTIAKADKVLIIATPEYKKRADKRERGVGYETSLITDELIKDQNVIKFIPIIRNGSKESSYPSYLGNRKGLFMGKDIDYTQALNELIDNIRNY